MTTDAEAYAKAKEDMAFAMSIGRLDLAMELATLPLTAWKPEREVKS